MPHLAVAGAAFSAVGAGASIDRAMTARREEKANAQEGQQQQHDQIPPAVMQALQTPEGQAQLKAALENAPKQPPTP